jgi:hypothetical protein
MVFPHRANAARPARYCSGDCYKQAAHSKISTELFCLLYAPPLFVTRSDNVSE